jgi:hypothetical protein
MDYRDLLEQILDYLRLLDVTLSTLCPGNDLSPELAVVQEQDIRSESHAGSLR